MNISGYNRVIIVGNNGSGKSFLSKELAVITSLPLIHLDTEFWRPNWEEPSADEWRERQKAYISGEKWIIEGNHTGTMELRFEAADMVIFLDINRLVCMSGVLKRQGRARSDTTQYADERFDARFVRFCKGLWTFPKTRKLTIMGLHNKYPDKPFLVIGSRKAMNRLIAQWRAEMAGSSVSRREAARHA